MKVYLDENLSTDIARILQRNGVDAASAHKVGNAQLDDHAQLAYAKGDGRAIVTANVVDFLALAHAAVATNTEHVGIILIPSSVRGDEFTTIAEGIREVLRRYPEDLRGLVIYIRRQPRR